MSALLHGIVGGDNAAVPQKVDGPTCKTWVTTKTNVIKFLFPGFQMDVGGGPPSPK